MDVEEFENLIDRLGDDISHWPEPYREQARALLQRSSAAREIEREAAALREGLRDRPAVRAPAGLADRIVATAMRQSPPSVGVPSPGLLRTAWMFLGQSPSTRPALLLSLCFLVGMAFGLLPLRAGSGNGQVDFPTLLVRLGN